MIEDGVMNVVVLGDSGVGKSTLCEEYTGTREGLDYPDHTVAVDVHVKSLRVVNRTIDVCFYDMCGDKACQKGLEFFVHRLVDEGISVQMVLLCCDGGRLVSIESAFKWLEWFRDICIARIGEMRYGEEYSNRLNSIKVFVSYNMVDEVEKWPDIQARGSQSLIKRTSVDFGSCAFCASSNHYSLGDLIDDAISKVYAGVINRQSNLSTNLICLSYIFDSK